jgi:hypothetical protein
MVDPWVEGTKVSNSGSGKAKRKSKVSEREGLELAAKKTSQMSRFLVSEINGEKTWLREINPKACWLCKGFQDAFKKKKLAGAGLHNKEGIVCILDYREVSIDRRDGVM